MRLSKKIFIILCLIAATLLYWEIFIRIFSIKDYWTITDGDPKIRINHRKNFSGNIWIPEENKFIYVKTNNLGFIGDDYALEKPSDTIRIAFLGNSMVEGLQVDYYNNFIELLENSLNTSGICQKKIEIMNYGIGGLNAFDDYQVYKNYVASSKPDLVILGFFDNNVENPAMVNYNLDNFQPRFSEYKNIAYKSELIKFLIKKYSGQPAIRELMQKANIIKVRNTQASNKTVEAGQPLTAQKEAASSSLSYIYAFTEHVVKKLDERVKNDDGKFMVLFFSLPPNDKTVNNPERISELKKLSNYLNRSNIAAFDSIKEFKLATEKFNNCLYDRDCSGHLNSDGHQAMATILHNYLTANYLTKKEFCR